jgi:hypothetical protein
MGLCWGAIMELGGFEMWMDDGSHLYLFYAEGKGRL